MTISRISCQQAFELMQGDPCQLVDIRDEQSYAMGHPSGAALLNNDTLPAFMGQADLATPTLIFCYHGNSSQQAAAFFQEQGFSQVHSVDGGFEQWRQLYPKHVEQG
ncbi:MAG: thiosulfate sulfurtransferase GlpE [Cellvibrionaceae bacterium]